MIQTGMIHRGKILLAGILLSVLVFLCLPSAACGEESPEISEWTVLVYLCGSDLESRYGYATENLDEILRSELPFDMRGIYMMDGLDLPEGWDPSYRGNAVQVLVQTGGCSKWHAEKLEMEIRTDCLQRWRFATKVMDEKTGLFRNRFELEEEQPLANMADPGTLADFIRWGTARCPAKKYALVLWDHGEGSYGGMFIDEMFPEDRMYLDELHQALQDGGITFEAVVFDACLMANVETAAAIKDNARWMVASEENVPGRGTAIGEWIHQLYYNPEATGEWLGRWICEMTQIKYRDDYDGEVRSLMTWSVIDLSVIDDLLDALERFFADLNEAYIRYPVLLCSILNHAGETEEYGTTGDMRDIAGVVYRDSSNDLMPEDLRKDLLDALIRSVKYVVRGSGRTEARGLSICKAFGMSKERLDIYARNCPFPHFLALLDAVNTEWQAPDWVYEHAQRMPELPESGKYDIRVEKKVTSQGIPGIVLHNTMGINGETFYRIYRESEKTGQLLLYGASRAFLIFDEELQMGIECPFNVMTRPAIEGINCDIEMVDYNVWNGQALANVPIQVESTIWNLRIGFDEKSGYTIYGLWEGYDDHTGTFSRNVKSLSQFSGQDFRFLYPVYNEDDSKAKQRYEYSASMPMKRWLDIREKPVPPGKYYIQYQIADPFGHYYTLEMVPLEWDGEQIRIPEGVTWEGFLDESR